MAKLRNTGEPAPTTKEQRLSAFGQRALAAAKGVNPSAVNDEPEVLEEEALGVVSKTNKRFQFGLTEWENEQIEKLAKASHISTAMYARAIILSHIHKTRSKKDRG